MWKQWLIRELRLSALCFLMLLVLDFSRRDITPVGSGECADQVEQQQKRIREGLLAEKSPKERNLSPNFEPFRIENEPQVHGEPVRANCKPEPAEKFIHNNLTKVGTNDQPKFLSTYIFPDLSHGVFVESGAANHLASNTFGFEKNRCWTGICVEPTKKSYNELVENRHDCYLINGALASKSQVRQFLDVEDNVWLSGFEETMPKDKKELIKKEGYKTTVIDVQTYLLHELLASHGMWHVDLWSLDCEGCEMEVLKSFRFDIITVDVLLVEFDGIDSDRMIFLECNGYEFVACAAHDGVFVRRNSQRHKKVRANLPSKESTCTFL